MDAGRERGAERGRSRVGGAATRYRTQGANRQDALDRLADVVRAALLRPRKRKKTKPSKAAKQRRIQAKKNRSQTKANRRFRSDD